jgi:hypothetical protein
MAHETQGVQGISIFFLSSPFATCDEHWIACADRMNLNNRVTPSVSSRVIFKGIPHERAFTIVRMKMNNVAQDLILCYPSSYFQESDQ